MARKKRKKSDSKRIFFGLTSRSRKKRKTRQSHHLAKTVSVTMLAALAIVCLFATAGMGFVLLEKYVNHVVPVSQRVGALELTGVPDWVSQQLQARIYAAATAGGEDLRLDKDAARSVCENLVSRVPWLANAKVQTAHDSIRIHAQWRKPVALVKLGLRKFYVDANLVVLDFVPIPALPVVRVAGLSAVTRVPQPGQPWQRDDLAAAVAILTRLDRMDKLVTPDKPLLAEIDRIDVSNFSGRQSNRLPHVVLFADDNTQIIWGAEYGRWQRYLESTDKQKIAKLYQHYKQYHTLLGGVKYINLREPGDDIPLPIDRY